MPQKVCLVLALLCWIVAALLAVLTVRMMNDPGAHGMLQSVSIVFGFAALLAAAFGFILYWPSKCSSDSTADNNGSAEHISK